MKIVLIEPFLAGSHASWATGLQKHSRHQIEILAMSGKYWKWRMHGGAITLAKEYQKLAKTFQPDLILATDMLDLTSFLALACKEDRPPVAVYFHENQLAYPWSPDDADVEKGRDFHYGFMNWTTALVADKVFFNSAYNLSSFYDGVNVMLKAMPDCRHLEEIALARSKSSVLGLGIQLKDLSCELDKKELDTPVILWNHRWEYDKGAEVFFETLKRLQATNLKFKLIICGESYVKYPTIFDNAKQQFKEEIIHFGYAESRDEYKQLLQQANILPVTNLQEFFGQSLMEALTAGCFPILPNRLVYPDHIPDSLKNLCLYDSDAELSNRLIDVVSETKNMLPITKTLQQLAMKYDWSRIVNEYDDQLDATINA